MLAAFVIGLVVFVALTAFAVSPVHGSLLLFGQDPASYDMFYGGIIAVT
jgi:hypothetical protein